jgi:hypothetical protein
VGVGEDAGVVAGVGEVVGVAVGVDVAVGVNVAVGAGEGTGVTVGVGVVWPEQAETTARINTITNNGKIRYIFFI